MGSRTRKEAEAKLKQLGTCPLCGGHRIELRWSDSADLVGYCTGCREYFEV